MNWRLCRASGGFKPKVSPRRIYPVTQSTPGFAVFTQEEEPVTAANEVEYISDFIISIGRLGDADNEGAVAV